LLGKDNVQLFGNSEQLII